LRAILFPFSTKVTICRRILWNVQDHPMCLAVLIHEVHKFYSIGITDSKTVPRIEFLQQSDLPVGFWNMPISVTVPRQHTFDFQWQVSSPLCLIRMGFGGLWIVCIVSCMIIPACSSVRKISWIFASFWGPQLAVNCSLCPT
jgi:hypothetical protein